MGRATQSVGPGRRLVRARGDANGRRRRQARAGQPAPRRTRSRFPASTAGSRSTGVPANRASAAPRRSSASGPTVGRCTGALAARPASPRRPRRLLRGQSSIGRRAQRGRSSFRSENRRPDHVSSIAHTLVSTQPDGSRSSRSVFSVMSVGTPLERFGQATHTEPDGVTAFVKARPRRDELRASGEEPDHDVERPAHTCEAARRRSAAARGSPRSPGGRTSRRTSCLRRSPASWPGASRNSRPRAVIPWRSPGGCSSGSPCPMGRGRRSGRRSTAPMRMITIVRTSKAMRSITSSGTASDSATPISVPTTMPTMAPNVETITASQRTDSPGLAAGHPDGPHQPDLPRPLEHAERQA